MITLPALSKIAVLGGLLATVSLAKSAPLSFNRDVRPLLSDRCFQCHGPDEKKRQGDLRLDTFAGATSKGKSGEVAILPGKPEESEMIKRILTHDADDAMPPAKAKKPAFAAKEIETLKQWIQSGAKYEGHWAFQPVANPPVPAAGKDPWCRNEVDAFILDRLTQAHIKPSPEADRTTLLRRVYLDLVGLLPTPEETKAFVADAAPDAYERLVDRLLKNEHFGERWGRHWLDQARYADSDGYSIDADRAMWPYRDWVIKAVNDDMPFDQFTVEQLAGDLLPNATKSQQIATAFHRNTLINSEGGVDPEQYRVETVLDRVNTTAAVWMGLTMGCAQCHTHKYDPISHKEYYQFFSFFNSTTDRNDRGATISVAPGEVFGKAAPSQKVPTQPEWEQATLAALEKATPKPPGASGEADWKAVSWVDYDTETGAGFVKLEDNSLLSDGKGSFNDTYRVSFNVPQKQAAALRIRAIPHESLPQQGPGRASNGNFVITKIEVTQGGKPVPVEGVMADHEQPNFAAIGVLDDNPKSGWAINVAPKSKAKMNAEHTLVIRLKSPVDASKGNLEIKIHHDLNQNYLLGRFSVESSTVAPKNVSPQADDALLVALRQPAAKRSGETKKLLSTAYENATANLKSKDAAALMVMAEMPKPRPTHVLLRGDFTRPDLAGGEIAPGVLDAVQAVMPSAPGKFSSRLDLARWLVNPAHPLTPRVTVNRVWMRLFGRGLVETEEDFGTQGTPPSHPELLDWMSKRFTQNWSMKQLIKTIVTSATYRQSSNGRPDLAEKDPRNLLLARQERNRLESEIIRDAALVASGLLDSTIGGPGVRPAQPDGVYAFTQNSKKWDVSPGTGRFRRGLYTTFYRSAPHPLFSTFDTPDFQTTCTRRARSNTPLQALMLANNSAFLELARGLAGRLAKDVPGEFAAQLDRRIDRAYVIALSREPSSSERATLHKAVTNFQAAFIAKPAEAAALLDEKLPIPLPPAEAASLTMLARILFNTDNFISRE